MAHTIIEKAITVVQKAANKYQPATEVYYVVMGTDEDRLDEHPCMENYCEKCINNAVMNKKRQYFLERTAEMGKIYEYQQSGFYREPQYQWSKDGKASRLIIKKISSKEPKDKVIKHLQRKLRKKYPVKMNFSYRYTSCGETDDFDLCEGCGVIFDQGLLLSSQELEHWEQNVSDEELKKCITNPSQAYQLYKILLEGNFNNKHTSRISALAKRIINGSNIKITFN